MYVKLFQKILDSSIWEESARTRVVWVTLLASMDYDGFCQFATIETLARRARIKPCFVREAVAILEAPDKDSSTSGDDGRRIERVAGGWIVLNAKKYRAISRAGELRASRPKSSESVRTGTNTSEHVHSNTVTTNGINASLPEVEVDKEVDIDTPIITLESFDADIAFEHLCTVYKKAERSYIAQQKFMEAVEYVVKKKSVTRTDAAAHIAARAERYCSLMNPKFQNGLTKWLENKIFEQEDATWSQEDSSGQNQPKRTDSLSKQADRNAANLDAITLGIFGANARRDAAHGSGTGEDKPDTGRVGDVGATGPGVFRRGN
jgi:hypothetical protein